MPSRSFSASSYKYGFNGKEKDDEVKGGGNSLDYGSRIFDSRLGRFLSVDPLAKNFSFKSTYDYAENDVIRCVDLDGEEKYERTGDNKLMVTIVLGVISDPSSSLLGKNYKPVVNTLDFTKVEAKLKEKYKAGTAQVDEKLARKLGFTGKADKNGKVTVQVEFNVSIKDVGKGEGFISKAMPENTSLVVKGATAKNAPGEHIPPSKNTTDYTVINGAAFTEGKTDEILGEEIKTYYNNLPGVAEKLTTASPGGVIGHEVGHKIFGEGDAGHTQGGVLDVQDSSTNQENLNGMFDTENNGDNVAKMVEQIGVKEK
jgi:RHS repeat-associated protein